MANEINENAEKIAQTYIQKFLKNEKEVPLDIVKKTKDVYQDIAIATLPMNKLYHPMTRMEIRALDVGEISNYSTLESNDPTLVRAKLDEILEKCVKVSLQNTKQSYKSLLVFDRLYMIYTLRELTFQNGRILTLPVTCTNSSCKHDFPIELIRQNIEFWQEQDSDIWKYFSNEYSCFIFETTIKEEPFLLKPPTIGLQESFYYWIENRKFLKKEINAAFVKIAPYTLNAVELTIEELDDIEKEFISQLKESPTGEEEFQFLNDTVDSFKKNDFKIGIRGLVKLCPKCGQEVRTPTVFPRRARDLFIVPDAFRAYLKK
jgi:hypothetical protein